MHRVFIFAVLALLLWSGCTAPPQLPRTIAQSPEVSEILREIRRIVPQVSGPATTDDLPSLLSARFSSDNPEKEQRIGPSTAGEQLYLFPGGHYCYVRWADIQDPTIYDRGQWTAKDGALELKSEGFLTRKDPLRDRRYVLLFYTVAKRRTLLLLGTGERLEYFKAESRPDDDFMLFLCTFTRIEPIPTERAKAMRRKLYVESWRPEFFK